MTPLSRTEPARREAREEKEVHASTHQNTLGGSRRCGGAPRQGTLSDAPGRRLPGSYGYWFRPAPVLWAKFAHVGKFSPLASFSLLDRARPVFSFSAPRKRENGGCVAQPSPWLKSSARKGKKEFPRPKGGPHPRPRRGTFYLPLWGGFQRNTPISLLGQTKEDNQ